MSNRRCPNPECPSRRDGREARITTYGFYKTRSGKRRRYLCRACGSTFSSTKGTAYYRLQHRRTLFDEVASSSGEGVSKSAISRVEGMSWNTVGSIRKLRGFRDNQHIVCGAVESDAETNDSLLDEAGCVSFSEGGAT